MADPGQDIESVSAGSLEEAYRFCLNFAGSHYENFPVASLLIPARLRKHIAAVYAFSRIADDFADEGNADSGARVEALENWRLRLARGNDSAGVPGHPVFLALRDTIAARSLDVSLFHNLLDAFLQDARNQEYQSFDELRHYCTLSANPVGRIVLSLFGLHDEERGRFSDALCTGLQLANFLQDLSVDIPRSRLYLPQEDLERFSVDRGMLGRTPATPEVRSLVRFELERTREYFYQAIPLFRTLPGRLRLELKATWYGGMCILDKIESLDYDTLSSRPLLKKADVMRIFFTAMLASPHSSSVPHE
jgi:squalene synthase HpnC